MCIVILQLFGFETTTAKKGCETGGDVGFEEEAKVAPQDASCQDLEYADQAFGRLRCKQRRPPTVRNTAIHPA